MIVQNTDELSYHGHNDNNDQILARDSRVFKRCSKQVLYYFLGLCALFISV